MKFQDLEFKTGFIYVDDYENEWILDCEGVNFIHRDCGVSLTAYYNQHILLKLNFEKVVSWNEVPIDTKIFVRDSKNEAWKPRHFAGYKNGMVTAFSNGKSSFTLTSCDYPTNWFYAKLAETMD